MVFACWKAAAQMVCWKLVAQISTGFLLCLIILFLLPTFKQNARPKIIIGQRNQAKIQDLTFPNIRPEIIIGQRVEAKIQDLTFPIYLHLSDTKDLISDSFAAGNYWERTAVIDIMNLLKKNPEITFIDLGANIGSYSLAVGHMRQNRVIAVEASSENARLLRQSVFAGEIAAFVKVLHNAVSDEHTTLHLAEDPKNRGNTHVFSVTCNVGEHLQKKLHGEEATYRCVNSTVETITMDDLLPLMTSKRAIIKADIQGSEMKAFNRKTAAKFFQEIDVELIYMEWVTYQWMYNYKDAEQKKTVDDWLDFFTDMGYTFNNLKGGLLDKNWNKWPYDIAMKKKL